MVNYQAMVLYVGFPVRLFFFEGGISPAGGGIIDWF